MSFELMSHMEILEPILKQTILKNKFICQNLKTFEK